METKQSTKVGEMATCAETGKKFIIERIGSTFNYAKDSAGNILSDEGVDIREKRELLDRTKPFGGYVSSSGKAITGWKGNKLMTIDSIYAIDSGFGRNQWYVSATDIHGQHWYGRNGGHGMCITMRPKK